MSLDADIKKIRDDNPDLREIDLSKHKMNKAQFQQVLDALAGNSHLEVLQIRQGQIWDAPNFLQVLTAHAAINTVYFTDINHDLSAGLPAHGKWKGLGEVYVHLRQSLAAAGAPPMPSGAGAGSDDQDLRAENQALRAENARLHAEVAELRRQLAGPAAAPHAAQSSAARKGPPPPPPPPKDHPAPSTSRKGKQPAAKKSAPGSVLGGADFAAELRRAANKERTVPADIGSSNAGPGGATAASGATTNIADLAKAKHDQRANRYRPPQALQEAVRGYNPHNVLPELQAKSKIQPNILYITQVKAILAQMDKSDLTGACEWGTKQCSRDPELAAVFENASKNPESLKTDLQHDMEAMKDGRLQSDRLLDTTIEITKEALGGKRPGMHK